ncbi:MAG: AraC family transcriptional regulator [Chitinophagaceae bacterium]|nr:MAG: AraC family transcriptional regulator [Chitinophagaceae bacterium]
MNILTVDAVLPEGIVEAVTPYPPSPFQSLMFYCNDPVAMGRPGHDHFEMQPLALLTGPQFSRVNIRVHQQLKSIRFDFLPGGLYRMLGIPMHELFDGGYDAVDLFGSGMKQLNEQLKNTINLEDGKNLVETFLMARQGRFAETLPFDRALIGLLKQEGGMDMETAASLACLSSRQFERKCNERLGMNPKMYSRILRFSKAYRLHESFPDLPWISIAHQAGYYDQMHMIRDFKVFAGVNPSVIEQQLHSTPLRMQKDMKI